MPLAVETRPSKKQRVLLSFIDTFIKGNGYGPSYREVMRALNYKSVSTVAVHIDNLIQKGHLRKRTRSARSLEVVYIVQSNEVSKASAEANEKSWLINRVNLHFNKLEANVTQKSLDEAYVLVGAMHVLKLPEATTYKRRLSSLAATD